MKQFPVQCYSCLLALH
uniref:Uncharacterized protein n=1 Tax=Rhizophora mucronata TaxID=61149 RepID=A0A2P2NDW8_RHIMU